MLGGILGETLRQREGAELYETVERVRALSKSGRAGSDRDLDAVAGLLRELPVESTVPIARAFSHFLTLANIAEQHHRVRRRRAYLHDASAPPQRGSCEETFARLMAGGVTADDLHAATASLRIELVLTAHPTTITRRTLIQKHLRIAGALARQDRVDLTAPERAGDCRAAAPRDHRGVGDRRDPAAPPDAGGRSDRRTADLRTDAVGRRAALPAIARRRVARRDRAAAPLEAAPIRFGSWMGGDRDGNPDGHARGHAARVRWWRGGWRRTSTSAKSRALRAELSMTVATPELRARAGGAREPYRAVLREVRDRLRATRDQPRPRARARRICSSGRCRGSEPARVAPYRSIAELRRAAAAVPSIAHRDRAGGHRRAAGSPTCCGAPPPSG